MRLFALLGALILAGGVYLGIAGAIQLNNCISFGTFSTEIWAAHFWLLYPDEPSMGLGPNAGWFLRVMGGVAAIYLGGRLIKFSTD